ncbi:hypothetical protein ZIOFF_058792 [Zingiber officinale]|uniref:tetraacyldisaccharide 4'-kinase n=1 Tax=Zingiber officinale TaxID=94328 RepID=A0A8J5KEC7_ZINOF|nr:hypothetical protein ZIOFF_058792 [Zingiber officinale]
MIVYISLVGDLVRLMMFLFIPYCRLPVPVISVGNLTWGGNGKTPMVEFIARIFLEAGISPLILTRGYAGGDEVKMIQRHLAGTPTRIGVGANRSATAASIFRQHGYMKFNSTLFAEQLSSTQHLRLASGNDKVAVAILDDGMQHWSLSRDVEMVMINGLIPWGNNHLLPRGSLREPLDALCRADITVIHHADLVWTVLCVSGIGSPCAFAQVVGKIGPSYVDRLDFDDHHSIQFHDIKLIKERLEELANRFREKIIVVVTEKDYDRDPLILTELHDFDVLVLCCSLHIMTTKGQSEESFKIKLKELLISKHGG